ncbi:MAG: fibro-slime domain-containing protein [Subdoligranulum sp.]
MRFFFENNMATVAQVKEAGFFYCSTGDPLWNNVLPSSQRERRVSRLNRTGKNTTGWARRLTALLVTACLVMAMALPVYAEVDPLPDAPDEVELLEDEPGTASGEDTVPPEQNAATPVPDAATPEPEQSAEPEQPAPTETPEPTAEPTPTPEPAATATATPVPTVTPTTATPKPTEQPQKMYAAKSLDNVQAVSETGVPATYTLYFAVPSGWRDFTSVKIYAVATNDTNKKPYTFDMQEADKTKDGRKIYSAVLNKDKHYPHGGLNGLEFHGYNGNTLVNEVVIADADANPRTWWKTFDPNDDTYIGGNYYDPEAEGEKWSTYTVTVRHDDFAGKEMSFENKTSETLTDVKAWFYEPNEKGDLIPVGNPIPLNDIAPNSTATFNIPDTPDAFCSFVRFTESDGDKDTEISEYYNFYNEEVKGENQKRFQYSEGQCYCYMYNGIKDATWGRPGATRIYYDATFSKMALNGDTGDFSIPKANNNNKETIYYRIKGDGVESESGTLVKDGTNENLYYIDIPQGYRSIIFSGEEINDDNTTRQNGVSTEWLPIPTDDKNCFYADTNDDAVYKGTTRGGYWAPKGTLRDAEKGKDTGTKVVDIAAAEFTEKPNTKYVTSTLYDYYTDYELNGKNRKNYDNDNAVNQRHWVPFRQFDQAISDYYQSYVDNNAGKSIIYPIYTGHFQPNDWEPKFEHIASALNLYGWSSYNIFIAANNSNFDIGDTKEKKNSYAFQGIVADKRDSDGDIVMNGTTLKEPHFNEEFLTSQNSKNAKLGEVYHNVEFPFTQKEVFVEPEQDGKKKGQGVEYWWFDSSKTSLYLRKDTKSDQLYLGNDSTTGTTANYKSENSRNVNSSSSTSDVSTAYGFFPFNETTTSQSAVRYNYGYGAKLEIPFTLTSTGTVKDDFDNEIPIRFYFSGDDDVWVFIDDQLVLDIGGAHAKVSGVLEFDQRGGKKDTVTSYVSQVKNNKTRVNNADYGAENCDEHNHTTATSITYLGTTETYYKNASVSIPNLSTGKHTLTMYYMERGMWESNMAVAFNFPDNNELQVQKEVDLNKVDPDFKNCFEDQKIFNFTIQNQATHYGEKVAVGSDTSTPPQEVKLTADSIEIKPATQSTEGDYIFKLDTNPEQGSGQDTEQVLHWYARYTDTEPVSAAREKRYGILTLKDPINIKDKRFLTFQVYVAKEDGGGDLSLNNLYLELLDDQTPTPVQKGSLGTSGINGATYGSVEVKTGAWVTVKLDLNKMKAQDGFNGKVKTIRVGDNYSRHIYFRNFTFIPKAVPKTMTGFTTDQKEIPDYGSAKTGQLQNAINAQYTSTKDNDTQLVDDDGRFVLEDGETVTFSDQFRRGSYISLKEDLNQNLYDTTWTVCENGQAVTSMKGDSESVTVTDTNKSLDKQEGSSPNDGRTEKIRPNDDQTGNSYTGNKPSADTIVFRSYKDPDENSSTLTKLKVKYVNTVKTGGLKIQKKAAEGETLTGTYTFKVTFNDVGGEGLEEKPIERTVTIKGESTGTITGIPVGTRYIIEEVGSNDGAKLQSVTVPDSCKSAHVIKNNTMVEGVIEKSKDPNNPELTAIFTNTQRTLINIEFDKLWKDANGKDLTTENRPGTIYIQLQRRLATSQNDADWKPVNYPRADSPNYVTINRGTYGWLYTFSGLDQYQINTDKSQTDYVYRIVEGTVENDQFEQVAPGETITIKGNTYVVTAEATAKSEKDSETGATTTPAKVNGGTITGVSGKIELTNTLQNPKFVLDIIKQDANNEKNLLDGVEFKLEKLKAETTGGEPQVDTTYKFSSNENKNYLTGITGADGKITNMFTNLEPGTYRLTETKAHPGYNLLAKPIEIKFTQEGKCYIDGLAIEDKDKFKPGANNTYTMTLTVLNRKTPELPHTGADAPSLWLLIGMPLAVAGLLIFTFRYNRKGGRRH